MWRRTAALAVLDLVVVTLLVVMVRLWSRSGPVLDTRYALWSLGVLVPVTALALASGVRHRHH